MKKAFTLSEVLIALAVIGTVAAMTIPSLLQRSEEKIIVSGLQKSIAILDAGFRKIMAEERVSDIRYTDFYRDSDYNMAEHPTVKKIFKITGTTQHEYINPFKGYLEYTHLNACLGYEEKEYDEEYYIQWPEMAGVSGTYQACTGGFGKIKETRLMDIYPSAPINSYRPAVLANGVFFWIFEGYDWDYPIYIFIDANGKRGPNTFAYDVHRLGVQKDGHVVPITANLEYNVGALRIKQDGWKLNYKYEN